METYVDLLPGMRNVVRTNHITLYLYNAILVGDQGGDTHLGGCVYRVFGVGIGCWVEMRSKRT